VLRLRKMPLARGWSGAGSNQLHCLVQWIGHEALSSLHGVPQLVCLILQRILELVARILGAEAKVAANDMVPGAQAQNGQPHTSARGRE
jgi:hypothetical protein